MIFRDIFKPFQFYTTKVTFINDYVTKFSAPLHITVNNGTQFHPLLFKDACELFTTSFHPSSNPYIESNRKINNVLAYALGDNTLPQWEEYLSFAET